jgi:hypothetical protein
MDSVQFPCPSCRQLLQLPRADAGKRFLCPACRYVGVIPTSSDAIATVPLPPAAAPPPSSGEVFRVQGDDPPPTPTGPDPRWYKDDALDPSPAQQRARQRSAKRLARAVDADPESQEQLTTRLAGWRKVRWGINLVYFALIVWVATVVLTMLAACVTPLLILGMERTGAAPADFSKNNEVLSLVQDLTMWLSMFLKGVGLLVDMVQLAGYAFCLFVPSRRGALAWAVAAMLLAFGSFGLTVIGLFVPFVPLLAMLVGLTGWITFLLFLRAIGVELDVNWLVQDIHSLLSLAIFGVGGSGFLTVVVSFIAFMTSTSPRSGGRLPGPLGCGMACVSGVFGMLLCVVLFRYLHILRDTAAQIEEEQALRVQPLNRKTARRLRDY